MFASQSHDLVLDVAAWSPSLFGRLEIQCSPKYSLQEQSTWCMDLLETQKYLAQIICHTPGDGKLSWSLGSNAWPLLHGAVIPQDIFRTELREHTYNLRSNTQVNLLNTQYSLVWLHEQTLSHLICIWPAYLLTRHPTLPNCIQPTTVHVCSCLFHPYFMLSKMTSMWDPSWE